MTEMESYKIKHTYLLAGVGERAYAFNTKMFKYVDRGVYFVTNTQVSKKKISRKTLNHNKPRVDPEKRNVLAKPLIQQ